MADSLEMVPEMQNLKTEQDPNAPTELTVVTLNTWLMPYMPKFPFLDHDVKQRATKVGNYLNKHHADVDVILLQEVWSPPRWCSLPTFVNCCTGKRMFGRPIVEKALQDWHVSRICTENSGCCWTCKNFTDFLDSGLMVASRFPIQKQRFIRFSSGAEEDVLAIKGVLYVYINGVIIGNTHLNAKYHLHKARKIQIDELVEAFNVFKDDCIADGLKVDKLLIAGDWNIDGCENVEDNSQLPLGVTEYDANLVEAMKSIGLTDCWKNDKKWDNIKRTVSYYKEIGATSIDESPQRLDMIFSNGVAKNITPMWKKSVIEPALYLKEDEEAISDHAPLRATLQFGGLEEPPRSERMTSRGRMTSQASVISEKGKDLSSPTSTVPTTAPDDESRSSGLQHLQDSELVIRDNSPADHTV